jgi:serine/threonine protein kinase
MDDNIIEIKEALQELIKINNIKKILTKEIQFQQKIGEGSQAKVFKAIYQGDEVAIKILQDVDWKNLIHEIVILANLKHPNIPKFYGLMVDDKTVYLILKLIPGKTLDKYLQNDISFDKKINIVKQLANVLDYIHGYMFIHRDLKPENIIIDEKDKLHLIDFGISKVCSNMEYIVTKAKGTLNYLAPECLEVEDMSELEEIISIITPKVDVWAFGCITSYIFSGVVPWCDKYTDNPSTIQKVLLQKTNFSIPDCVDNNVVRNLIEVTTIVDPDKRASMKDAKEILKSI